MRSEPNKEKHFLILSAFYVVLVILSNMTGGKLVPSPFNDGLLPSSLFLYPFTYFVTDLVAEIYGGKKARFLIYLGFGMAVLMHSLATLLIAIPVHPSAEAFQLSLKTLFSFNGLSLVASLAAFIVSQLIDVKLFLWLKEKTGGKKLWLRVNTATILSQVVDSFLINFILFWGLMGWSLFEVFDIFVSAIVLKIAFSFLLTPLFYVATYYSKRFAFHGLP